MLGAICRLEVVEGNPFFTIFASNNCTVHLTVNERVQHMLDNVTPL